MNKKIPKKNYYYYVLMIIASTLLTLLGFKISRDINSAKIENGYLKGFITEIKISELDSILSEPSTDMFILITKTNDKEIYNIEKRIKDVLIKYGVKDNFLYIVSNGNTSDINKRLDIDIQDLPTILYYRNGQIIKTISNKDGIDIVGELEKIIDEYEVG